MLISTTASMDLVQLLSHARALIGVSLADLADTSGLPAPLSNLRAKGWAGQIIERELGADGSGQGVNFAALGVELKTVPTDPEGWPLESTWICHVDPNEVATQSWHQSYARLKLQNVLFVTLSGPRRCPVGTRVVSGVGLWHPSADEDALLGADFEFFSRIFFKTGDLRALTGHHGRAMQVRPKGTNARDIRKSTGHMRLGFYLRATFMGPIIRRICLEPQR